MSLGSASGWLLGGVNFCHPFNLSLHSLAIRSIVLYRVATRLVCAERIA